MFTEFLYGLIKQFFFAMARINVALMFDFSSSTHIVNKKSNLMNLCKFLSPNHRYQYSYCSQYLTCILVAYTMGDIVLSLY